MKGDLISVAAGPAVQGRPSCAHGATRGYGVACHGNATRRGRMNRQAGLSAGLDRCRREACESEIGAVAERKAASLARDHGSGPPQAQQVQHKARPEQRIEAAADAGGHAAAPAWTLLEYALFAALPGVALGAAFSSWPTELADAATSTSSMRSRGILLRSHQPCTVV